MRRGYPDITILVLTLILVGTGWAMVCSASAGVAGVRFGDPFYFLKRHLLWSLLGGAALCLGMAVEVERWRRWVKPILLVSLFLMVLVLVPGLGRQVRGARRWLDLQVFTFQPVELVKIALVFFLADWIARDPERIKRFLKGLLPPFLLLAGVCALLFRQPDLGTGVLLGLLMMTMCFVGGARVWQLLLPLTGLSAGVAALVVFSKNPYWLNKIVSFWDPWQDPLGKGYQIIMSLVALGSGGIFGAGLGLSTQKLFYLPDAFTDFIFAIIGEELGLLGATAVIVLFVLFVLKGIQVARGVSDPFSALTAFGFTTLIGLQAFINIGVVSGALPNKGLTLPFISFGGSSLVFTLFGVGILLNISRQAERRRG